MAGHKRPITACMYTSSSVYICLHTCLSNLLDSWLLCCSRGYLLGWPAGCLLRDRRSNASWLLHMDAINWSPMVSVDGVDGGREKTGIKRRCGWWTLLRTAKEDQSLGNVDWEPSSSENNLHINIDCKTIILYLHSIRCRNHCRLFGINNMRSTARRDMQVLRCVNSSQSRLIMAWTFLLEQSSAAAGCGQQTVVKWRQCCTHRDEISSATRATPFRCT